MVICLTLWSSCDEKEPIPSYLYIESIALSVASDGSQGSASHDIVDAWVYVDNQHIGVFELPAHIPVLNSGKKEVVILAGIKKNGQANNRIIYPFYTSYTSERELIPAHTDTLRPVVGYRDGAQFAWKEDFEDQIITLEKSGLNSTVDSMYIVSDPSLVFEYDGTDNKFSGHVILDSGYQIMEFSSKQQFELPRQQTAVFMEFNYRCDIDLESGFYPIKTGEVNAISVVRYFPSETWKKAYVSLTEDLAAADLVDADAKMFFGAFKGGGDEIRNVYIDNIKLIHF